MKKEIVCPNCKEKLNLPIDKCSNCGFIIKFHTLKPVMPVEAVEPIEAVVTLDYDPKIKKDNLEETSIIPTVVIYEDEDKDKTSKKENLEETSIIPTIEIYEDVKLEEQPKQVAPKERKRVKKPIDYEMINHEKRLSFALVFVLVMCSLTLNTHNLPLFSVIYDLMYTTEIPTEIYDILAFLNSFGTLILIGYYILVGILSIDKKRGKRLAALTLTIVSIIMHIGFMLALQFISMSAGITNYIVLVILIIWCAAQSVLLNIKREG